MRSRNASPRIRIYLCGILFLSLGEVLLTCEHQKGNPHVNHERTAYVRMIELLACRNIIATHWTGYEWYDRSSKRHHPGFVNLLHKLQQYSCL